MNNFRRTNRQNWFLVDFPEECFPSTWLGSTVPVIFDFTGMESIEEPTDLRNNLYCLRPKEKTGESIVAVFPRALFISNTINGTWFKKQQESHTKFPKTQTQNKIYKRRRSPTHYYDPRKDDM